MSGLDDGVYALAELLGGNPGSQLADEVLHEAHGEIRRLRRGLVRLATAIGAEPPEPWDTMTALDRIEHQIQLTRQAATEKRESAESEGKKAEFDQGLAAAFDRVLGDPALIAVAGTLARPEVRVIRGPGGKRWAATLHIGDAEGRVALRHEEAAGLGEAVAALRES